MGVPIPMGAYRQVGTVSLQMNSQNEGFLHGAHRHRVRRTCELSKPQLKS